MEIMAREKCGLLAVPSTAPVQLTPYVFIAHVLETGMQPTSCVRYEQLVACLELQKCLFCFPTWNTVTCILCMDFATAMHMLLLKNIKGVFLTEGFHLEVYLLVFTRQCVILAVFRVLLCSLKGRWYERLTHERTDLTPLDDYLWGHMKTFVYETKVESRAALCDRIFAAGEHIRNHPDNVASATQSLLMRAEKCMATGGHFEQL